MPDYRQMQGCIPSGLLAMGIPINSTTLILERVYMKNPSASSLMTEKQYMEIDIAMNFKCVFSVIKISDLLA